MAGKLEGGAEGPEGAEGQGVEGAVQEVQSRRPGEGRKADHDPYPPDRCEGGVRVQVLVQAPGREGRGVAVQEPQDRGRAGLRGRGSGNDGGIRPHAGRGRLVVQASRGTGEQ